MTATSTLPRFIPCTEFGAPGSTIARGHHRGRCARLAELMNPFLIDRPPYYRCPSHGTQAWVFLTT